MLVSCFSDIIGLNFKNVWFIAKWVFERSDKPLREIDDSYLARLLYFQFQMLFLVISVVNNSFFSIVLMVHLIV